MRHFIMLAYIFLACGRATAAGTLTLNDIPLSWEYFQPKAYQTTDLYMAYINTNLRYKIIPDKDDNHFLVECEMYIDAAHSTVNKNFFNYATPVEKQQLLDHEKCHVIIAYICNKNLQLAFAQAEFPYDVKTVADSIFSAIIGETNSMNTAYDEETAHGRHGVEQERWKNKLLAMLNDLYTADDLRNILTVSLEKPPFLKFYAPQEYAYQKVQPAFEDNFDDDRNGWLKKEQADTGILAWIKDGVMELSSTRKSDGWSWNIQENIDYSRDFEIHFSFKINMVDGRRERAAGVYWGASDSSGFSWIALARAGVELINCHGGDHKSDVKQYMNSYPALKEGVFYKIAIRKVKDKYAVFLNDKFKAEALFEKPPGNQLALGVEGNAAVAFDYLRIYYLD